MIANTRKGGRKHDQLGVQLQRISADGTLQPTLQRNEILNSKFVLQARHKNHKGLSQSKSLIPRKKLNVREKARALRIMIKSPD